MRLGIQLIPCWTKILLISCHSRFCARINVVSSAVGRASLQRVTEKRVDRYARNEGLISALWQLWNDFSRNAIIHSALGTTTASGMTTNSRFSNLSEGQLLSVCRAAASGQQIPGNIRPLRGSHLEPTWGDARKIQLIVNCILPTNHLNLLSGFGIRTTSLDIQTVRNACAHISLDRINDIRSMQTKYSFTHYNHPSDVLFWIEPTTGNELWQVWVDELKASAAAVVT